MDTPTCYIGQSRMPLRWEKELSIALPREATWICFAGCTPSFGELGLGTCVAAARHGHLAALQWARANGAEWGTRVCSDAAMNGHLHVLRWARENGCAWDKSTCEAAAANGHLDERQAALESLTAIKRAGADLVFSYWTKDLAQWL